MASGSKKGGGNGQEKLPPVSGQVFSDLIETMKDLNRQRRTKSDLRSTNDHWSHPDGQNQPALVLVMNDYVDDSEAPAFIPSEIALCSFSLQNGLSPDFFWTLVDPGRRVPKGHGVEAAFKATTYGIPYPGYAAGLRYQNYPEIVANLETMITTAGKKPIPNLGYVFWCEAENVTGYTLGLQWLYEQAGLKFAHKVMPLESLLVTLSMGGLEGIAARRRARTGMTFPQVLDSLNNVVASASGMSNKRSVAATLESFMSTVSGYSFDAYSTMAGSSRRYASTQFKCPEAVLGAFIFEEQASTYLKHMGCLYVDRLACDYHQDLTDSLPPEMAANLKMLKKESRPSNKLVKCALLNARRLIFLAMDVLLVNYQIRCRRNFHYLPEDEM